MNSPGWRDVSEFRLSSRNAWQRRRAVELNLCPWILRLSQERYGNICFLPVNTPASSNATTPTHHVYHVYHVYSTCHLRSIERSAWIYVVQYCRRRDAFLRRQGAAKSCATRLPLSQIVSGARPHPMRRVRLRLCDKTTGREPRAAV